MGDDFLIHHIALGDGQQSLLVEQFGVVLPQLAQQNLIVAGDIVGVGRHHKEQHRVALDVAQKACADTPTLVGALNDTGDVGHHKGVSVPHLHDAEIGLEGGEGIVCNFGLGGRHHREQRRFARIGEAHQSHIGQHFEFKYEGSLLSLLTGLCVTWSLICGGLEVPVAQATTTTFEEHQLLAVGSNLAHNLARLGIACYGAEGYFDNLVGGTLARHT